MTTATEPMKPKDYKSVIPPTWCPGCGDYGVLNAAYKSFADLKLDVDNTVLVSGIGCSSRFPYFVKMYGLHTAHGRALPVAAGVKMGNPDLEVIVFGGDGDGFSIGGGHVPHIARKNTDITYVLMDNSIYGLTKGQVSPTSELGLPGSLTPYGTPDNPVNPIVFCLAYGATFVAQGYSSKSKHVQELITKAIQHKGFSFVNIISPCPTFNKKNTFESYKNAIDEIPADHDVTDKVAAMKIALSHPKERVPTGILYQEQKPTLLDRLNDIKVMANGSDDYDINELLNSFKP